MTDCVRRSNVFCENLLREENIPANVDKVVFQGCLGEILTRAWPGRLFANCHTRAPGPGE